MPKLRAVLWERDIAYWVALMRDQVAALHQAHSILESTKNRDFKHVEYGKYVYLRGSTPAERGKEGRDVHTAPIQPRRVQ
jgi:hypothetical protein